MKFIIANDHAAVELKQELKTWLAQQGHEVVDIGVESGKKADYPGKGEEAARLFMKGGFDYGIVCCGTGIGISIAANKVRGIRCALPQNVFASAMAKEHNNCQFIAFGSRINYQDSVTDMLQAFLNAEHEEDSRHAHRVTEIMKIEEKAGYPPQ